MTTSPQTDRAADVLVAEARRAVHESLILLPAPEADRVRALIADLETAVEGRTAMRTAAVSAVVPPTQDTPSRRAGLRDLLRRAACEAEGFAWDSDMLEPDEYGDHADAVLSVLYREWPWLRAEAEDAAVLAVLPPPANRAAVLAEAADEAEKVAESLRAHHDFERSTGVLDAMTELRRLAAETQQTETETPTDIQVWPLHRVLAEVRCGSQDWTWDEEWVDLDAHRAARLAWLETEIRTNGITTPVLIGSDGRLWDGHQRLRIAVRAGIGYVPVEVMRPAVSVPVAADTPDETVHSERITHIAGTTEPETQTEARRGDAFEQWLKAQRDLCFGHATSWGAVDGLLDQYRLHADTGTPLGEHVCEGRVAGDCECLETTAPAVSAGVQTDEEARR